MSIFGSMAAPDDDEHEDDCARWEKQGDVWDISDRACDCGQPDAPLVYQGSHVLPSLDDARGGSVDLAMIPGFVRVYRDDPEHDSEDEDSYPPEPFLRFGVNTATVILTRRNVEQIHESLSWWLDATAPTSATGSRHSGSHQENTAVEERTPDA